MSIGFNCCCSATNPCNCTWPASLTYAGSVGQCQAAFYFVNVPDASPEATPYTLTWQPRPAEIPRQLQLLYYSYPGGVHDPYFITMPAEAWFSVPIPGTIFNTPTDIYFYLWAQSCQMNVMVIDAPYGSGYTPGGTRGAGNNVINYVQQSCTPFQMTADTSHPPAITGTHGGDDVAPGPSGGAGFYFNPRIGLAYGLAIGTFSPSSGSPSSTVAHGSTLNARCTAGATDYPVTWTSSDTGVFTVASTSATAGLVTGVAPGSATLTGSYSDPDASPQTASVTVTVT